MAVAKSSYANPHLLVEPQWLAERLGDQSLRIIDSREPEEFAQGHIPGAANIDFFALSTKDTSPEGLKAFRARMEEAFSSAGLQPDQTVVFYEETCGGHCARGVWLLEYFGGPTSCILNGGLQAWEEAGLPVTTEIATFAPSSFRAQPIPEKVATYQYILDNLGRPGVTILDVRSREEYLGTRVRSARGGAIPGAIHLEYTNSLLPDGRFKSPGELAHLFADVGVTPDQEIIPYCQGGYRSAHTCVALRLLGYPRVRNYVGSWGEWGNRQDLPIEKPGG